ARELVLARAVVVVARVAGEDDARDRAEIELLHDRAAGDERTLLARDRELVDVEHSSQEIAVDRVLALRRGVLEVGLRVEGREGAAAAARLARGLLGPWLLGHAEAQVRRAERRAANADRRDVDVALDREGVDAAADLGDRRERALELTTRGAELIDARER